LPACFYSYIEKVNSAAFIANPNGPGLYFKGPFLGKKALLVLTAGNILPNFTHGTGVTSIDGLMFGTMWGSFYAVGFSILRTILYCGLMIRNPGENDAEIFAKFREDIRQLETRPVIDIEFKGDPYQHELDEAEKFARLPNLNALG
jgi:putative NADPH-quinone reductase